MSVLFLISDFAHSDRIDSFPLDFFLLMHEEWVKCESQPGNSTSATKENAISVRNFQYNLFANMENSLREVNICISDYKLKNVASVNFFLKSRRNLSCS